MRRFFASLESHEAQRVKWGGEGSPAFYSGTYFRMQLRTIGDPILRKQASEIADIPSIRPLAEAMIEELRNLKGAGLAAPQIGESLRLFVVEIRKTEMFPDRPESPVYVFINPVITPVTEETEVNWEACFSVPGFVGRVRRPTAVSVSYTDIDGVMKQEIFEGYLARVIQHESDHLDGVLYVDRLEDMLSLTTAENFRRFQEGS